MQASLGRSRAGVAGAATGASPSGLPQPSRDLTSMQQRCARLAHQRGILSAARLAVAAAAASAAGAASRSAASASSASAAAAPSSPSSSSPPPPEQQQPPSATLVDAAQRARLAAFLDHLLLTNETMNLTAVRDRGEAWTRHVEDSLALLPVIERWAPAPAAGGAPAAFGGAAASEAAGGGGVGSSGAAAAKGARGAEGKRRKGKQQQQQQKQAPSASWFEDDDEQAAGPTTSDDDDANNATAAPPAPSAQPSPGALPLRLIDVGTGPGLPGMVLAIARPHWRVTLLDSLRKRCDFLRSAAARLGLSNVDVVWSRAEDAGRLPALRDAHDVAVARAVAESRVLAELCLPFVRPGGVFVAAKGTAIEGEVEAARGAIAALSGRLAAVETVESFYASGPPPAAAAAAVLLSAKEGGQGAAPAAEEEDKEKGAAAAAAGGGALPTGEATRRTAIVISKVGATPAAYPRPPGTPNKKPL